MSNVRFIADLHFGHKWAAKNRGFSSIEEHNDKIIENWNKIVTKRDLTIVLGDVTMEDRSFIPLMDKLLGKKILIGGNHDIRSDYKILKNYFEAILGCEMYKGFILTHIPIHPSELEGRFRGNIHGHIHNNIISKPSWSSVTNTPITIKDTNYINVCCEQINLTPVSLKELGFS